MLCTDYQHNPVVGVCCMYLWGPARRLYHQDLRCTHVQQFTSSVKDAAWSSGKLSPKHLILIRQDTTVVGGGMSSPAVNGYPSFWLQHLHFDVFLSFNYRKRLLHLLNWGPLSKHLSESFPVGGILGPNWIALKVTPCRLGHALACIQYVPHELSTCIMQEPSDEIQTKLAIIASLTASVKNPMCAMISRDWYLYICA